MANSTFRVFKSALIGAVHNQSCEEDTLRDMPELAINIKDPDAKLTALNTIATELYSIWDDDRTADMTDEDIDASIKAEAEEIYNEWVKL